MAAAEFYNSHPPRQSMGQPAAFLTPPHQPQRASSNPGFPFGQQNYSSQPGISPPFPPQHPPQPPPPYNSYLEEPRPGVHFAPPPFPQRHSFSNGQRPNPPVWNGGGPTSRPEPGPNPFLQPGPYQPQRPPYQQQQRYSTGNRPYVHNDYSHSSSSVESGYASDPGHRRKKHKHRSRRVSETSRSTTADGLIGAAGGSLIGDLIFPGLGTVGGALAGWIGGKDYGKHRKWREEKRDREQEKWEKEFRHRERSHSHDHRKNSHDRRRSYD